VEAGDADIVDPFDAVAHEFRRGGCFLSNGQVSGAGADQTDAGQQGFGGMTIEGRGACKFVIGDVGNTFSEEMEDIGVYAGNEQTAGAFDEAFGDGDDLLRRLSLAEDDLGQGGAEGAMMVDLGKAEVLVGQVPEPVESAFDVGPAGRDGFKEGAEGLLVDVVHLSFVDEVEFRL
jgi:hypothetical protein